MDEENFKQKRNELGRLREEAKSQYITNKLHSSSTPKDTYGILNTLLHSKMPTPLPDHESEQLLAEDFSSFFDGKITEIRNLFPHRPSATQPQPTSNDNDHRRAVLSHFHPVDDDTMEKVLSLMPSKMCELDPLPTWVLKKCPSVVKLLSHLVNWTIEKSTVSPYQEVAHIRPKLKKPSADPQDFKNFRHMSFIAKITEKVICNQLTEYCEENHLNNALQSAYRRGHSTETALTKVQDDLLRAVDSEGGAILILLDLSAAFDTIDHDLLLDVLSSRIGICDRALSWFRSYFEDRQQAVVINEATSKDRKLSWGVPQGSILGPCLFSIYVEPLATLILGDGLGYHQYADDTQIYLPFDPKSADSVRAALHAITEGTRKIKDWMEHQFLKLNEAKTEVVVITRPSLTEHTPSTVSIAGVDVETSTNAVKNLGVLFDPQLNLEDHIKAMCKKAYFQIRLIGRIRRLIPEDAAKKLVQANVTCYIDQCNSLLVGLPQCQIQRLQRVQNSAARLIQNKDRRCHITPILKDLHWLPVSFRVKYKVNVTTFKALNGLGPSYLRELLHWHEPPRPLRSATAKLLRVPSPRYNQFGRRAFSYQAPILWNDLPLPLRELSELNTFKKKLKTFYFNLAFNQ